MLLTLALVLLLPAALAKDGESLVSGLDGRASLGQFACPAPAKRECLRASMAL